MMKGELPIVEIEKVLVDAFFDLEPKAKIVFMHSLVDLIGVTENVLRIAHKEMYPK